jgi:hypothetical protein
MLPLKVSLCIYGFILVRLLTSSSSYNSVKDDDDDEADVAGPSILAEVVLAKVPSK